MVIGAGGLGGVILELLAREEGVGRIVVGGRSDRALARCNLVRLGAVAQGYTPAIDFVPLDLTDRGAMAETIAREAPDLILSTATLQTWWLIDLLPPRAAEPLRRAGLGMWLPIHLPLSRRLMEAVRDIDYTGITLTAPFPDVVNCVLGRAGLAPDCGIGNVDEVVPKVRLLAAERLRAPLESVRVTLVAHHALESRVFGAPSGEMPPYFLRVQHNGRDVTEEVEADALLRAPYPVTSGPSTHFLTAGSAVRLIRALLSECRVHLHAPGPHGLPGGYPVTASRQGVQVASIAGLTMEEAIEINERSHRFDGIARIESDGTVVFCPSVAEIGRATLGYECDCLRPDEAELRARELMERFRGYARRHGVDLPAQPDRA